MSAGRLRSGSRGLAVTERDYNLVVIDAVAGAGLLCLIPAVSNGRAGGLPCLISSVSDGRIVADLPARCFRMRSLVTSRTSATVLRFSAMAIGSLARVALRSHLVFGVVPTHGASVGRCGAIFSAGLP